MSKIYQNLILYTFKICISRLALYDMNNNIASLLDTKKSKLNQNLLKSKTIKDSMKTNWNGRKCREKYF